jgi:hypothetical protein
MRGPREIGGHFTRGHWVSSALGIGCHGHPPLNSGPRRSAQRPVAIDRCVPPPCRHNNSFVNFLLSVK